MLYCDNHCETCNKYSSVHYHGTESTEYNCIIMNKDVTVIYDEDGREIERKVW